MSEMHESHGQPPASGAPSLVTNPGLWMLILNILVVVFGAGTISSRLGSVEKALDEIKANQGTLADKATLRSIEDRVTYLERILFHTPPKEPPK